MIGKSGQPRTAAFDLDPNTFRLRIYDTTTVDPIKKNVAVIFLI